MAVGAALLIGRELWLRRTVLFSKLLLKSHFQNILLFFFIVLISAINWAMHIDRANDATDFVPLFALMPLSLLCGAFMRASDIKWLVLFIAFESLVGVLEFVSGVPSFIPGVADELINSTTSSLLYYRRAYGLSANSSILAVKCFIALLFLSHYKLRFRGWRVASLLVWLGILVTFNRSVIFAVLAYYLLKSVYDAVFVHRSFRNHVVLLIAVCAALLIFSALAIYFADEIVQQFTRGKGLDLSGRDKIWSFYSEFILKNPIWGNGMQKLFTPEGKHAHNSFLQSLASNGLIVTLLLLWFVFRNITLRNAAAVLSIILYSMTQYGIFWGISLLDIALFAFLFGNPTDVDTRTNELQQDQFE
ncbi:MAG: hypothetical protein Kow0075_05060 [Salibacteraceae bacterium]